MLRAWKSAIYVHIFSFKSKSNVKVEVADKQQSLAFREAEQFHQQSGLDR
jgi:ornithine carbamoyltransferase